MWNEPGGCLQRKQPGTWEVTKHCHTSQQHILSLNAKYRGKPELPQEGGGGPLGVAKTQPEEHISL